MVIPQTEIIINLDGLELARTLVEPGGYVIGADAAADIVAQADGIARYHAHLTVTPSEMHIQDLGSESGTFVAGVLAAETVRVWPNQKVLIGPAVLEARRVRSSGVDQSLSPPAVAVRRILPEEFLRGRKYEIGGTIGQGGMGAVLSAREATTHRTVAMKVMLANISETDVIRFIAEAQITSQLEHPNIVPVHELGVDEHDQVFYTMKHVQGVTLRTVLEKLHAADPETCAAYPLRRLLVVLLRVCDAMAFAHSRGVIHRDLKPDNVMIGDFGEVLVMDWGLAKVLGSPTEEIREPVNLDTMPPSASVSSARNFSTDSLTVVGALVGTPHYMSPEQASCEVDTLDERTDVWALGAILRHILSLTVPVPGERSDEITANVRAGLLSPIPPLAPHCPGGRVPDSLIAVTNKAQALRREDRYQSVLELRSEIDAYLGGFATDAEKAGALRQLWLLMMRHRAVTGVLLALFILSIVFVVRLLASESRAEKSAETARVNERVALKNERHARNAQADAVREKEAARQALGRSQMSLADAAYRESNSAAMLAALESVPADLRDSDWRYLRTHAENSLARVSLPNGTISIGAAAHPKRPGVFAVSVTNGTIILVDARSGQTLQEISPTPRQRRNIWFRALSFSPDGTRLAVGTLGDGGVSIYRVEDGHCLAEWAADSVDVVEFSRDGTEVLAVDGGGELTVHDAETGALRWKYRSCMRATFAPGGDVIVGSGNAVRLIDKSTQTVIREFPAARAGITWLTMSPNGEILYTASRDGIIRGMKFADGTATFEARLNERGGWPRLAVSADGRCLLAGSGAADRYRAVRAWDTETGVLLRPFLGAASNVEGLAIHPLTDDVLVTGADTRIWSLASRAPRWAMKGGGLSAVFWGADDLFIPGTVPVTLQPDGALAPPPWKWSSEWRATLFATTGGDYAVVGRPNGSNSKAWFAILRKSAGKVERLHAFEANVHLRYLRLSRDGSRFASCDYYSLLYTYDTATAQRLPRCDASGIRTIGDVAWLGNQRLVGIASIKERGGPGWEERVILWDVDTGRQIRNVQHPTMIDAIAASADGRIFAEAGVDKKVRLRDPETLQIVREFRAHDGPITALAFHPSKPILATGSADSTIRLWNLQDDTVIEEIRTTQKEPHWLQFSPSGSRLSSADPEGNVSVWDLSTPAPVRPVPADRTLQEQAAEARKRGEASARASKWAEAQSAFAEAARHDPVEETSWYRLSPLLVHLGDPTAGRKLGHDLLDRFGKSNSPVTMERAAKATLLLPLDDADRTRAVQLAHTAAGHTTHPLFPFFQFVKGFAEYRAGEFAAATQTLQSFQGRASGSTLDLHAMAVLAMSLHRNGKLEEARTALAVTREAALHVLPKPDADQTDSWHDVLTVHLLLREATAVIEKK
jgi:WD40 repeat protein/serine/threonine protein kinase